MAELTEVASQCALAQSPEYFRSIRIAYIQGIVGFPAATESEVDMCAVAVTADDTAVEIHVHGVSGRRAVGAGRMHGRSRAVGVQAIQDRNDLPGNDRPAFSTVFGCTRGGIPKHVHEAVVGTH